MEMIAKKLICVFCFLAGCIILHAQSGGDNSKSIAEIKRGGHFLYAETTMKDPNEACNGAKAILEVMVGDWVHEQYPDEDIDVCIVKAKEHCQQMQTRRGDYYRAFVYVKKSDILPVSDKSEIAVFQVSNTENDVTSNTMDTDANKVNTPSKTAYITPTEQRMVKVRSFYDIEPFIKQLKETGMLNGYGKYAKMPSDSFVHLFVYDKEGNVVATLRNDHGEILNLDTLQQDDIKNYKNCGAIWFQLKNTQQ